MKKIVILVICYFTFADASQAQRRRMRYAFDYGFGLGVSNYLGEMGGKERTRRDFIWDMKLKETRWAMTGFARYKFNNYIAAQTHVTYLRIAGDDALSTNRARRGRNLNFINDMLEVGARADIYIYGTNDVGRRGTFRLDFKSYFFVGLDALVHGPKTRYNNSMVRLRKLQTEGVRYSVVTPAIPVGLGFYFTKKRRYRFGFEVGWRLTFTDYLDDVSTVYADPSKLSSQTAVDLANRYDNSLTNVPSSLYYQPGQKRGDPSHNDTYFYSVLTYSYVLKGHNTFYTQNYNWLFGKKGKHRLVRVKF